MLILKEKSKVMTHSPNVISVVKKQVRGLHNYFYFLKCKLQIKLKEVREERLNLVHLIFISTSHSSNSDQNSICLQKKKAFLVFWILVQIFLL